jgi:hypothetical protein
MKRQSRKVASSLEHLLSGYALPEDEDPCFPVMVKPKSGDISIVV